MGMPSPSGVLVVDKPRGPTSHDVVSRLRRALGVQAVGHAGTLDPMATGVLVVAIGEATKLVPWLTAQDKGYEATIALGVETDTLDADGRELRRSPPSQELLEALAHFQRGGVGGLLSTALEGEAARTTQTPPAYSAIKTGGQRAFVGARRGEPVELAPRDVHVTRLALLACSVDPPSLTVSIDASKGYYVRAFARDLAAALGTLGHLTSLHRTRSGCFVAEEAIRLEAPARELLAHIQPPAAAAARTLPVARLTQAGARDARHGRPVPPADIDAPTRGPCAWLDPNGELVAIGEMDDAGRAKIRRGFA